MNRRDNRFLNDEYDLYFVGYDLNEKFIEQQKKTTINELLMGSKTSLGFS
jgi:hypothetical protein